ncbi:unnamed protein product, partial [marine sediment metagenome]
MELGERIYPWAHGRTGIMRVDEGDEKLEFVSEV